MSMKEKFEAALEALETAVEDYHEGNKQPIKDIATAIIWPVYRLLGYDLAMLKTMLEAGNPEHIKAFEKAAERAGDLAIVEAILKAAKDDSTAKPSN